MNSSKPHHISIVPLGLIWEDQDLSGWSGYPARRSVCAAEDRQNPADHFTSTHGRRHAKCFSRIDRPGLRCAKHVHLWQTFRHLQSALQAREALGTSAEKVHVMDSNATAMAMGFPVLATARAAEAGAEYERIALRWPMKPASMWEFISLWKRLSSYTAAGA
jgi:hypothetical protein